MDENNKNFNFLNGIGTFFSNFKDKTLNFVDSLQDQITAIDQSLDLKTDHNQNTKIFDKSLIPIIENVTTYIEEPNNSNYKEYLNNFDVELKSEEIHLFNKNSLSLSRIYSRLVPSAFTEKVFWSRLFFKIEQFYENKNKIENNLENNENEFELTKEEL